MKIKVSLGTRFSRSFRSFLKPILYAPLKLKLSSQRFVLDASRTPAVSYAGMAPLDNATCGGGRVKLLYLNRTYPQRNIKFNILYLVSSNLPPCFEQWIKRCKKCGIRIVLNQNGVAYPGWYGQGWVKINAALKKAIHSADYVIYQSKFAKLSADRFLGEINVPWSVVYNSVDTSIFTPKSNTADKRKPFTLLIAGSHNQFYRFQVAIRVFGILRRKNANLRLCVAGRLNWADNSRRLRRDIGALLRDNDVLDAVELLGPYSQSAAPEIFKKADILLHTQYNDVCPTLIIEAMACGLPVVYIKSGGIPELVSDDAGVGVDAPLDWEKLPDFNHEDLAQGVLRVISGYDDFAQAARFRALNNFDLAKWINEHQAIFEKLL